MQTLKSYFDLFNSAKATLFTIGVVIVAILNLWLSTKLSPLASNVESLNSRVNAIENSVDLTKKECVGLSQGVEQKLDKLEERVDRIDKKLETIDNRNLDIYKILINR